MATSSYADDETRKCCGRPVLVPDWARGKYGVRCDNCSTFTPADGSDRFAVKRKK